MKQRISEALSAISRTLRSAQGHFSAGLASMASLAWLLWPRDNWQFEPEPAAAFLLALVAWIFSIGQNSIQVPILSDMPNGRATQHDIGLLDRLRKTLPESTRAFLRNHDFGASFRNSNVDGIFEISTNWVGSDYEFDDEVLNDDLSKLVSSIRILGNDIAVGTWPIRGGDFLTAIPDREREIDDFSPRTREKVDALNQKATEVGGQLDQLLKVARQKLEP